MSTNIERAAEVMRRELDGMRHTCLALAEALAAEGLLVTDERTAADLMSLSAANDCPYIVAGRCALNLTDEQVRLIRLGKATDFVWRMARLGFSEYQAALDAIYATADNVNPPTEGAV